MTSRPGSPACARALADATQDVAVPEMHAVEGADGDDGSAGELRKPDRLRHRETPAFGHSSPPRVSATATSSRHRRPTRRAVRRRARRSRCRAATRRSSSSSSAATGRSTESRQRAVRSDCGAALDIVDRRRHRRTENGPESVRRSSARCAALSVSRPRSRASARMYVPPLHVIRAVMRSPSRGVEQSHACTDTRTGSSSSGAPRRAAAYARVPSTCFAE